MFRREHLTLQAVKTLLENILLDKELPTYEKELVQNALTNVVNGIQSIEDLNKEFPVTGTVTGRFNNVDSFIANPPLSPEWEQGVEGWVNIPHCPGTVDREHQWNDRMVMFPRKCKACGYTDHGPPTDKFELLEMRELATGGYEVFAKETKDA